ncbi:helix-turn-helix transcriptional regulator [Enterococcus sp. BWB1-3]|uniref:helix-turn-helix domain-containing protein n=1 Tax=Enterococcus sp. BWB1-3 TaxID=2787713 RepID=UPI0019239F64|nr:helix-turn-helix transcriptional regulator [Enterococcus sp. BWB1-3]MBL1227927.1 helix-turn-helix transcriptional regulator [Enterococcus sp. BWB1-3]
MKQRPPINSLEHKKRVGTRIKSIRKQLKLTQPEFGRLVNNNKPIDKKTIYEWEKGVHLPKSERLSKIANLGNVTVQDLIYGNIEEYIFGIILYRDEVILKDLTFSDMNLFQHLYSQYPPIRPDLISWIDSYFKLDSTAQESITINTLKSIENEKTTFPDIFEIENFFIQAIIQECEDNILFLTANIDEQIELMRNEWLPSQLENTSYPQEAITEIFDNISNFKQAISAIGQKYKERK